MRSSLKKSLYLGLAALSFASVAGASLNNTDASAKKTTKKAKKTAKKSTKKAKKAKKATKKAVTVKSLVNIDNQSNTTYAYNVTNGSLTNKPAGVKGSKTVVNGVSSSDYYMAYQQATLSNGQKYYKVVSFTNSANRGWVSANDAKNVNTLNPAKNTLNTQQVYLKYPGAQNIYKYPVGSTYKRTVAFNANDTAKYATDQFGISQTANVNGRTVYYIIDLNHNEVQGWVDSANVTTGANRYFDKSNDVKVNFNYNGKTVYSYISNLTNRSATEKNTTGNENANNNNTNVNNASNADVFNNPSSNDRVLNPNFLKANYSNTLSVKNLFNMNYNGSDDNNNNSVVNLVDGDQKSGFSGDVNAVLNNLGYKLTKTDLNYSLNQLSTVKVGDEINVNVSSVANTNQATSKFNFKVIAPNAQGAYNPADAEALDTNEVNFPSLNDAQKSEYQAAFSGNKNSFVPMNILSTLQSDGKTDNNVNSGNTNTATGTGNAATNTDNAATNTDNKQGNSFVQAANLFNLNDVNSPFAYFVGKTPVYVTQLADYTNGFNGKLAFKDIPSAEKAAANQNSRVSLTTNNGSASDGVNPVVVGGQVRFVYVLDKSATAQYNRGATFYGQNITLVYDKIPVVNPQSSNSSNNGFTGYQG